MFNFLIYQYFQMRTASKICLTVKDCGICQLRKTKIVKVFSIYVFSNLVWIPLDSFSNVLSISRTNLVYTDNKVFPVFSFKQKDTLFIFNINKEFIPFLRCYIYSQHKLLKSPDFFLAIKDQQSFFSRKMPEEVIRKSLFQKYFFILLTKVFSFKVFSISRDWYNNVMPLSWLSNIVNFRRRVSCLLVFFTR